MGELKQNYYGSLCTEMYEILQEQAQQNELDFYLSYAEKGKKIIGSPMRQRTVFGSVFRAWL